MDYGNNNISHIKHNAQSSMQTISSVEIEDTLKNSTLLGVFFKAIRMQMTSKKNLFKINDNAVRLGEN